MLCSLALRGVCFRLGESPPAQAGEEPRDDTGSLHGEQEGLTLRACLLTRSSPSRHVGTVPRTHKGQQKSENKFRFSGGGLFAMSCHYP